MSNPSPPQVGNPGEQPAPPYGQQQNGGPQGHPQQHHPGMMQVGHGMPYPPYMMFPMGGPFYMPPPHMEMGMPPGEMQFQGGMPMFQMPMGFPHPHAMMPPPHHMMPPHMGGMGPPPPAQGTQMNPNVPQFIPSNNQPQQQHQLPPPQQQPPQPQQQQPQAPVAQTSVASRAPTPPKSVASAPETPAVVVPAAKPVSRRLPIIDPTTGLEISIETKPVSAPTAPASALTPAELVLGQKPSSTPPLASTPTPTAADGSSIAGAPLGGKRVMKLKNAPIPPKPKTSSVEESVTASEPEQVAGATVVVGGITRKVLKGIKNAPLLRRESTEIPASPAAAAATDASGPKPRFKLVNKTLSSAPSTASASTPAVAPVSSTKPTPSTTTTTSSLPIPRETFLQYMSLLRPDRNAPSSINVFPSELLGLRTAVYADPGLAAGRTRRMGLQKTMSAVSSGSGRGGSEWRSGKGGVGRGGPLSRQTSGKRAYGGPALIVRASERGFKIIDQSSLSEKDKLRRQVMALLNKITVDSFGQITQQISEIEITQPWQMDVVIGLIFDKAVVEHSYSVMYAEMCKKLRNIWPELTGVDQETGQQVPVTFSRAIIEKCQVEFDAIPETLDPTEHDIARTKGHPEDLEMLMHKRKERILGNMKFIAQLFLNQILASRVIRSVVEQLLFRVDEPEEHYIECTGILLHNIGSTLMESEGGRAYVAQFVDRMHDLSSRDSYGKRIKFLMKDVIDAAEAGWEGRHASNRLVTAAKSKEAVRKDALEEIKKKEMGGLPNRSSSAVSQQQGGRFGRPSAAAAAVNGSGGFKPVAVLRRPVVEAARAPVVAKAAAAAPAAAAAASDEWSDPADEDSEDEVSEDSDESEDESEGSSAEYASSSEDGGAAPEAPAEEAEDEDEDGFTKVVKAGKK